MKDLDFDMFMLLIINLFLFWNMFVSLTQNGLKLLYKNCDLQKSAYKNKTRIIDNVRYTVDNEHLYKSIGKNIGTYVFRCGKIKNLSNYNIYNHLDCYGLNSIKVISKFEAMSNIFVSIFLYNFLFYISQGKLPTISFVILFSCWQLIDECYFIKMILVRFSRMNFKYKYKLNQVLQFFSNNFIPCDGMLYTLGKDEMIMLECCNYEYAFALDFKSFERDLKKVIYELRSVPSFSDDNYDTFEKDIVIYDDLYHLKLRLKSFHTANHEHIDFRLSSGQYYVEKWITIEKIQDNLDSVLEYYLKKIITAQFYGRSLKRFDKIREGFTHKKDDFNCEKFKIVLLKEEVIVKGFLNVDCVMSSLMMSMKDINKRSLEPLRSQIEYANIFFKSSPLENDLNSIDDLLKSIKKLLINKSAINNLKLPNSAWKRYCSDCGWISEYRYKGLTYKKPSNTLIEFAMKKGISLVDPLSKIYNEKEFLKGAKNTEKREYFKNKNTNLARIKAENEVIKSNMDSSHNKKYEIMQQEFSTSREGQKILSEISRKTQCLSNKDLNFNKVLDIRLKNVESEPTKEDYKKKLMENISELKAKMAESQSKLRDKSFSNAEKMKIKIDIPMYKIHIDHNENVYMKQVEKDDFSEVSRRVRVKGKETIKVEIIPVEKAPLQDEVILCNMFDVLQDLNDVDYEKDTKVNDDVKEIIRNSGGVNKMKEKVNKELKRRINITADELLMEKKREILTEELRRFSKKRMSSRSSLINRYKNFISKNLDLNSILDSLSRNQKYNFNSEERVIKRRFLKIMLKNKLKIRNIKNNTSEIFIYFVNEIDN